MQKPKYEVGQEVFVVRRDELQKLTITGVITEFTKAEGSQVHKFRYWFDREGSNPSVYGHQFVSEDKVFASKEEYVASL